MNKPTDTKTDTTQKYHKLLSLTKQHALPESDDSGRASFFTFPSNITRILQYLAEKRKVRDKEIIMSRKFYVEACSEYPYGYDEAWVFYRDYSEPGDIEAKPEFETFAEAKQYFEKGQDCIKRLFGRINTDDYENYESLICYANECKTAIILLDHILEDEKRNKIILHSCPDNETPFHYHNSMGSGYRRQEWWLEGLDQFACMFEDIESEVLA